MKFGGTNQTKNKKPRFHIFPNDNLPFPDYRRFCLAWLRQAYRILKPGSHVYIFLSIGVHIRIWLAGLRLPGLRSKKLYCVG
ncbi:hypothetical protein ACFTAO_34540 [Paenibacillus rhizoplanae]